MILNFSKVSFKNKFEKKMFPQSECTVVDGSFCQNQYYKIESYLCSLCDRRRICDESFIDLGVRRFEKMFGRSTGTFVETWPVLTGR